MDLILVNRIENGTVKRERGKQKTEPAELMQAQSNRPLYNVGTHICQAQSGAAKLSCGIRGARNIHDPIEVHVFFPSTRHLQGRV